MYKVGCVGVPAVDCREGVVLARWARPTPPAFLFAEPPGVAGPRLRIPDDGWWRTSHTVAVFASRIRDAKRAAVCEVAGRGSGGVRSGGVGGWAVCEEAGRGSGGVRRGGAGVGRCAKWWGGVGRCAKTRHQEARQAQRDPWRSRPHRHADHNDQRVPSPNATPTRTAGGCRPPTPRRPERPEGAVRHATPTKKAGGRRPQTTPSDHPQFLSGADPPCRHRNRPRRRPPRRDAGPPVRGRPRRRR